MDLLQNSRVDVLPGYRSISGLVPASRFLQPKLTRERDGVRHIADQPPVVMHVSDEEKERLIDGLEEYLKTLPPHWHRVLSSYVVVDVAHKVVGVGCVGLRAFVVLLQGNGTHESATEACSSVKRREQSGKPLPREKAERKSTESRRDRSNRFPSPKWGLVP